MDISVEPCRRRRMRPLPDSLALKWFCPGTRATILPRRVRRRRFENDLFDFINTRALARSDHYARNRIKRKFCRETIRVDLRPRFLLGRGRPTSPALGFGVFSRGRAPRPPKVLSVPFGWTRRCDSFRG